METIKNLGLNFPGKGEVTGFNFRQVERSEHGYIYEVSHPKIKRNHFEVFRQKINKRFCTVSYPKSKSFGIWAWIYPDIEQANKKLDSLTPK